MSAGLPAGWLQPAFASPRVRALMSARDGGVSAAPFDTLNLRDGLGDAAEAVARNRVRLQQALGMPSVMLRQVHGVQVVDLAPGMPDGAEADASVKANERDLEKAVIRSPVNGTILLRKLEVGQTVAASFTAPELFVIAEDLRKMELVVAVAESDIGRVDKGQAVEFEVSAWPKRVYTATVKKVFYGSTITNNVVTYSTELEVNNDDLSLRPGMTATADIFIERKKDVFTVSNSALRFDPAAAAKLGKEEKDGNRTYVQQLSGSGRRWGRGAGSDLPQGPEKKGTSVWVLKDGEPVEVKVTTGLTDGNDTEVSGEGLSEGADVIVSAKPAMKS